MEESRRRRRAVRPAGTVGGDEGNLRSSLPAPSGPDEGWGGPRPGAPGEPPTARRTRRAPDDQDVGWGPVDDSNDERLGRERPPHW